MRAGVARAVLVLSLLVLAGCGGEPEAVEASAPSPEEAIAGFGAEPGNVEASFAAIGEHARERPGELRDAALAHLEAEDGNVRYAAVYSLALTAEEGESLAALRSRLDFEEASERMLAAASLASRGETEALATLIAALGSEEPLRFRDPPQRAWQLARFLLVQYTGEDLGLIGKDVDAADAAEAQPRWEAWLREHGPSLRWDPDARRYQ